MKSNFKKIGLAAVSTAVGFALFLWSWNTLAALFGLPTAEARHALAALLIIGMLRFAIGKRGHRSTRRGLRHDH